MDQYLQTQLNLHLKDNWQVFPVDARGIDFIGFRCFHGFTLLRKRTYKRFKTGMLEILEKHFPGSFHSFLRFHLLNVRVDVHRIGHYYQRNGKPKVYADLIRKGKKTIKDVPKELQKEVKAILAGDET